MAMMCNENLAKCAESGESQSADGDRWQTQQLLQSWPVGLPGVTFHMVIATRLSKPNQCRVGS
jgi:hypothetical protein